MGLDFLLSDHRCLLTPNRTSGSIPPAPHLRKCQNAHFAPAPYARAPA
jgi:hypothetical protein